MTLPEAQRAVGQGWNLEGSQLDLALNGRTALITGASAGIGRATAKLLAEEGAHTILVGRRENELQEVAKEITAAGGLAPMIVVDDINDPASFERIQTGVLARTSRVDILINNVGQSRPLTWDSPEAAWEEAFGLNFRPARRLAAAFLPGMRAQKFGRIVSLTATLEPSR